MTPNPLIKNSFASPVKEPVQKPNPDTVGQLQAYHEPKIGNKLATMSSNKKALRSTANRDTSQHSKGVSMTETKIQKIDISQFCTQMDYVPKIKGIKK